MNIKQLELKIDNMQKVIDRKECIINYNTKLIDIANYTIDRQQISYMNKIESNYDFLMDQLTDLQYKCSNLKNIYNDIDNCSKMFLFEIEVYNEATKEDDYIIYTIHIDRNKHQFWSRSIDSEVNPIMDIDPDFSLDSNLESFYDLCLNDILESDDYNLRG